MKRTPSSLVALLLVLGLGGCGAPDNDVTDPYAADFQQATATATSDFERGVLEDGKITEAEYAEAQTRLIDCVAGHGYLLEATNPGYLLSGYDDEKEGEEAGEIMDGCARGTTFVLESLYLGIMTNPEKEDEATLIAACLVQYELVPEDFTADDFAASFADEDPAYDRQDPQVSACLNNPKGL